MAASVQTRVLVDLTDMSFVRQGLCDCWQDVSNAGGAVGFPFLPVSYDDVNEAVDALERRVRAGDTLVFVAESHDQVVGWVALRLNGPSLVSHWATVERLQSRPEVRGQGIGRALLDSVIEHGLTIGLEHLMLKVRGGEGLETFYSKLGWEETGRHPGALRLSADDDRDEVSMMLRLSGG